MQYIAYLWNGRTHDKYAMLSYVGEEELDAFKKRVHSCYPYTQGWSAEFSVFERIQLDLGYASQGVDKKHLSTKNNKQKTKKKMEEKFKSSIPDYKDESDCGLTTECRTEGRTFEAFIEDGTFRVIHRRAHSTTITHITGIRATGSEWSDKVLHDTRSIVTGFLSRLFNKAELCGYSYSADHKAILLSIDQESRLVDKDDLDRVCQFANTGNMTPEIMRSVIAIVDKDEFSVRMYNLMVEYAMG